MINLKETFLQDVLKDFCRNNNNIAIIYDENGDIITSSDTGIVNSNIYQTQYSFVQEVNSNNEFEKIDLGMQSYIVTHSFIDDCGWNIATIASYDELFSPLRAVEFKIILISALLLIGCMAICMVVSHKITRPVIQLSGLMKNYTLEKISKKDMDTRIREVKFFYESFNKMNKQINKLINDLYIEEEKKS